MMSSSSSSFYNQILNRLDTFLSPSNDHFIHTPSKQTRSTSFSPDLRSSFSSKNLSTSARLKKLASSIGSLKSKQSPLRNSSSSFMDQQMKVERLEDILTKEKIKNQHYITEIASLRQTNEELKIQLRSYQKTAAASTLSSSSSLSSYFCKHYNHKAIDYFLKENEELKKFKENVFVLSKRYDDLNENVLVALQQIDMLFTELNESGIQMTYNNKTAFIESSRASFETVINKLVDMMKNKQDEYNYLIGEKEREINDLIKEKKEARYSTMNKTIGGNTNEKRKNRKKMIPSCCDTNCSRFDEVYSSPNMDYKVKRIRKNYSCK